MARSKSAASPSYDWHYLSKFVLIGDSNVGKSALLLRVTDDRFLAEEAEPTVGVEFGSVTMPLGEDESTRGEGEASSTGRGGEREKVKIQIWDTAGSEAFRGITRSYYRGSAGCLVCYDVTSRASFEHCKTWLRDVREHAEEDAVVVLVGNRVDLVKEDQGGRQEERKVSEDEAREWAETEGLIFLETSAKTGENVHAAFKLCVAEIHRRFVAAQQASPSQDSTGANLLKSRNAGPASGKGGRRGVGESLNLRGGSGDGEGQRSCCTVM